MSLFDDIIAATRRESAERKAADSLDSLKAKVRDLPPTRGFAKQIAAQGFSLIAEVKRQSPSMGSFVEPTVAEAHLRYDAHPAVAAISVLTQASHFGGSPARLRRIQHETQKPILRKDFIFEEYEVYYSRYIGADAILLMANVVTEKTRFRELHDLALGLGMDVLCEVHTEAELEVLPATVTVCGVNSRKFKDDRGFELSKTARHAGKDSTVDLEVFRLAQKLPGNCLKIAESGISAGNLAEVMKAFPFDAALVGTSLLQQGVDYLTSELDRFKAAIDQIRRERSGSKKVVTV